LGWNTPVIERAGDQYADGASGVVNDGAQFYNPETGGFTSRDPAFAETDTAYTYAGDDPVNEGDPTGDCTSGSWWCDALHSVGGGVTGVAECLGNSGCLSPEGLANAAAGFANQVAHLVDGLICSSNSNDGGYCPTWSVGTPYPCASPGSYQVGEGLFFGAGFLLPGGDEADAAGEATSAAALPSTSSLSSDVADATGGVVKELDNGYSVTIPYGSRGIVVRVVDSGGGRINYFRISVPGKETFTVEGDVSTDPALTHIPIGSTSLQDILNVITRIQGQ
jgi:RHS repeat-associated protein